MGLNSGKIVDVVIENHDQA
jgi:hypothetical protein